MGNVFGFYVISAVTVPLVYMWFRSGHSSVGKPSWTAWVFGATGLALNVSGTLVLTFALSMGFVSLVAPISSAYPLVTVTAAVILLHEKLNRLQLVALACVITGLLMIAIIG